MPVAQCSLRLLVGCLVLRCTLCFRSIVPSGEVRDDLERAVFVADVGLVRMLLADRKVIKAGVPPVLVNRTDGIGRTALHKCGFDPQTRDLNILDRDCNWIAEILLKAGSGVDVPDQKGWTPLAYAASLGFAKTAATLVQHGAQVDSRDEFGRTSLMKAVVNGHFSAMHTLLGLGANPSIADSSSGWTPLFFAVRNSMNAHWERIIKVLLPRVADTIDRQDNYGRTVLMYAVSIGNVQIVKLLLRYGASIEVTDQHGYSAISLTDKDDVLQLLQKGIVVATERHVADWAAARHVYPEMFGQREEGILRVLEKLIAFESP